MQLKKSYKYPYF